MMRVVTQNLYGDSADWAARRSVLMDGLRALRPDLVAFRASALGGRYDRSRR